MRLAFYLTFLGNLILGLHVVGSKPQLMPVQVPAYIQRGFAKAAYECPEMAARVTQIRLGSSYYFGPSYRHYYAWVQDDLPTIIFLNPENFGQTDYTWDSLFIHEMRHVEQDYLGFFPDYQIDSQQHIDAESDAWLYGFRVLPCH